MTMMKTQYNTLTVTHQAQIITTPPETQQAQYDNKPAHHLHHQHSVKLSVSQKSGQ